VCRGKVHGREEGAWSGGGGSFDTLQVLFFGQLGGSFFSRPHLLPCRSFPQMENLPCTQALEMLLTLGRISAPMRRAVLADDGGLKVMVGAWLWSGSGLFSRAPRNCASFSNRSLCAAPINSTPPNHAPPPPRCRLLNPQPPQVSGLSDPEPAPNPDPDSFADPDRSAWSLNMLALYDSDEDTLQVAAAAARDPTCIAALLHASLEVQRRLASVTDPERRKQQREKVSAGVLLLHKLMSLEESLRPHVGTAVAAATPAALDALGELIAQPVASAEGANPSTQDAALQIACVAAACNPAAASALARRRSVVRALVAAQPPPAVNITLAAFMAMFKAGSRDDVMRALAAGQGGGGDGDDLVQRLREVVEAVVAGGGLEGDAPMQADAQMQAQIILAVLAEGEEWLKTQVDRQPQQEQQPGGGAAAATGTTAGGWACAGCAKTAADGFKLRRCSGCPPASAVRFCSAACQKAVWLGGHKRECPRLDR